eukprot:scaffold1021_cov241-Pinguiococcus_pyrenoidosus.AAC.16
MEKDDGVPQAATPARKVAVVATAHTSRPITLSPEALLDASSDGCSDAGSESSAGVPSQAPLGASGRAVPARKMAAGVVRFGKLPKAEGFRKDGKGKAGQVCTLGALPISLNLQNSTDVERREQHAKRQMKEGSPPPRRIAKFAKFLKRSPINNLGNSKRAEIEARSSRKRKRSRTEESGSTTDESGDDAQMLSMSFPLVLAACGKEHSLVSKLLGTPVPPERDAGITKRMMMAGTASGELLKSTRTEVVKASEVPDAAAGVDAEHAPPASPSSAETARTKEEGSSDDDLVSSSLRRSKRRRSKKQLEHEGGSADEAASRLNRNGKPATGIRRLMDPSVEFDTSRSLQEAVCDLIRQRGYKVEPFFLPESSRRRKPTPKDVDDYSIDVSHLIRAGNIPALAKLCETGKIDSERSSRSTSLNACNRFGESLLHFCARRAHRREGYEMCKWLLENNACPWVCDDFGRTPLHDAFWTPEPAQECVKLFLDMAPEMFFTMDSRGYLPLAFARRESVEAWRGFFFKMIDVYWPAKGQCPSDV